jgi:hypothetical protein
VWRNNNRANETRETNFSISNPSHKKVNTAPRFEVEQGNNEHFLALTLQFRVNPASVGKQY